MGTFDRNSKNINVYSQLGILLAMVGAGLVIGSIVSVVLRLIMTGRPLLEMETDMFLPKYYNSVMVIQVVSTFFLFFLPVYFTAFICYRKPARFMGFNRNINYRQVLLVLFILLLTFPLSAALGELNKMIPIPKKWADYFQTKEDARTAEEAALIQINSFSKYLASLVVIGLLPGLFEEVGFRSGLQNILVRWFKGPWAAIILTSIIFSLFHYSYYGFLVRFALGVILGFIFFYSENIWLGVLLHFLFNALQVTALYLTTLPTPKGQKDLGEDFPWWLGVVSLVLIVYLFKEFKKTSLRQRAKVNDDDWPDDDFQNWAISPS